MSKKLYQYSLNKVNPFLDETLHHVEKGKKLILLGTTKDVFIDGESGETVASSVFAKKIEIDKAQFAKIYVNSLASWFELSKTGIRVFAYIVSTLKPDSDTFILDYESCKEYTGYKSKSSIACGIKELIENKFIARGQNQYIYFINPTIFFNGNRITFLQQYVLKNENEKQKKINLSDSDSKIELD